MPFDNPQPSTVYPITAQPSLEALAWALEHPETWPDGFVWDYSDCKTCAMGLAGSLWASIAGDPETGGFGSAIWCHEVFRMPVNAAQRIFIHLDEEPRVPRAVTARHVASAIRKYLASR